MSSGENHLSGGNVTGRLLGKVAVITGVGDGQGREIALLFARAGAIVVGCDIDRKGLAGTRALAGELGLTLDLAEIDATNLPAMSLRFGTSRDGMPIGVQLVSRWFAESTRPVVLRRDRQQAPPGGRSAH